MLSGDKPYLFLKLSLKNFMMHQDTTIHLHQAPITLITGANGSGKTQILDALIVALGHHPKRLKKGKVGDLIGPSDKKAYISLTLQNPIIHGKRRLFGPKVILPYLESDEIEVLVTIDAENLDYQITSSVGHKKVMRKEIRDFFAQMQVCADNKLAFTEEGTVNVFADQSSKNKLDLLLDTTGLTSYRDNLLQALESLEKAAQTMEPLRRKLLIEREYFQSMEKTRKLLDQKSALLKQQDQLVLEEAWSQVVVLEKEVESIQEKWEAKSKEQQEQQQALEQCQQQKDQAEQELRNIRQERAEQQQILEKHQARHRNLDGQNQSNQRMMDQQKEKLINLEKQIQEASQHSPNIFQRQEIQQQLTFLAKEKERLKNLQARLGTVFFARQYLAERDLIQNCLKYQAALQTHNIQFEGPILAELQRWNLSPLEQEAWLDLLSQCLSAFLVPNIVFLNQAQLVFQELWPDHGPQIFTICCQKPQTAPEQCQPQPNMEQNPEQTPQQSLFDIAQHPAAKSAAEPAAQQPLPDITQKPETQSTTEPTAQQPLPDITQKPGAQSTTEPAAQELLPDIAKNSAAQSSTQSTTQQAATTALSGLNSPHQGLFAIFREYVAKFAIAASNMSLTDIWQTVQTQQQTLWAKGIVYLPWPGFGTQHHSPFWNACLSLRWEELPDALSISENYSKLEAQEQACLDQLEALEKEPQIEYLRERAREIRSDIANLEHEIEVNTQEAITLNDMIVEQQKKHEEIALTLEKALQNVEKLDQACIQTQSQITNSQKIMSILSSQKSDVCSKLQQTTQDAQTKGSRPKQIRAFKVIQEERLHLEGQLASLKITSISEEEYQAQKNKVEQLQQELAGSDQHLANLKQDMSQRFERWHHEVMQQIQAISNSMNQLLVFMAKGIRLTIDQLRNPECAGLQIEIQRHSNRWHELAQLSGGEKVLAVEALILALHLQTNSPLHAIDECTQRLDLPFKAQALEMVRQAVLELARGSTNLYAPQFILLAPDTLGVEFTYENFFHRVVLGPAKFTKAKGKVTEL